MSRAGARIERAERVLRAGVPERSGRGARAYLGVEIIARRAFARKRRARLRNKTRFATFTSAMWRERKCEANAITGFLRHSPLGEGAIARSLRPCGGRSVRAKSQARTSINPRSLRVAECARIISPATSEGARSVPLPYLDNWLYGRLSLKYFKMRRKPHHYYRFWVIKHIKIP